MRLLMLMACVGVAFAQPSQDAESNVSCVERLQMPVYPKLAEAARISGTVNATVVVPSDGPVQMKVAGHSILAPAVEKALRASTFRKACSGKSVTLVFKFVLADEFDPDKLPQRVSFGYPNQFWISVPPRVAEP